MNKYSRRYKCECGFNGRAHRLAANTGTIMCARCRAIMPADLLFRGNEEEEARTIAFIEDAKEREKADDGET